MLGQCATHPEVPAVQACERCGAFACSNCLEFTETEPVQSLCSTCFERYFGRKASTRAVTALVLAALGISGCWFLGIPAFILGIQELEAIERHEAPGKGKNLALGAKWLGLIQMVILALGLIGGVAYFLSQR